MFVLKQWVDWRCMRLMVPNCCSCTEEVVLQAVYENLCQCLGVCGATVPMTFPGHNRFTCNTPYGVPSPFENS